MRKNKLLLLLTVFITIQVTAQIKPIRGGGETIIRCYTTETINDLRKKNPGTETDAQFEAWLKKKTDERKTEHLQVKPYIVPLIFHIVYNGEAEGVGSNLSQFFIQQQILQLNKDYANQSNSPYAVAASTGIQFVLAQKDPSGNVLPQPGIERINRSSKGWTAPGTKGWTRDYVVSTIKPQSIWNPGKYANVWLVPAMNNGGTGKLLGFSTFPVTSTLAGLEADPLESDLTAGVVIDYSTVGSIFRPQSCESGWGRGKTLSHELGHYFGLRHIWGDEKCGNDYVDDTPVQEDANYGTPIHPKPNSCGTKDEMFENYMDYSNDEVLNTFTADQVDRMQTVMLFSPRRVDLPNSPVGFVAVTGSNRIAFASCSGDVITTETGTTGTYPHYKDISLMLNTEYQASSDATVTIKVTGTATSAQYQVLTPTLTFVKGDAYKPVTIRLVDNAAIDGDRTLRVSYKISGTGVVADTSAQTVTIEESDDDDIIFAGSSVIPIVNENFDNVPAGSLVPDGWNSYTSGGYPNIFVVSANGNAGGSGKAAHITNNTSTKPNTYTKGLDGAAELLSPQINPLQYKSLDSLKFKYSVRGSADDHGYVLYDIGDGSLYFWGVQGLTGSGPYYGTTATQSASLSLPVPAGILSKKFSIAFYWETGTAKTGSDPGLNIDDVSLTAEPYSIETSVASSYGYDVLAGTTNKFRSSNNKIVANISGASATIAGVSAAVTEAGNDKTTVAINGANVSRSRKVITLLPSGADSTATYTATFYFTAGEVAAWGANAPNLKLVKVRNGVSVAGAISSTDAVVITPSLVDDKLTDEGFITYTATLSGFGQFALTDNSSSVVPPPADTTAKWVKIYPNPVHDKVMLDFGSNNAQSATILITDMSGRILSQTKTTVQGHQEINLSSLSKAVYIMKIQTNDHTASFKIMKE